MTIHFQVIRAVLYRQLEHSKSHLKSHWRAYEATLSGSCKYNNGRQGEVTVGSIVFFSEKIVHMSVKVRIALRRHEGECSGEPVI